jgi:hypothetical protein
MLLYHLHTLVKRLHAWRKKRKAAHEIDAMLRGHGFVETTRGDWRKTMVLRRNPDNTSRCSSSRLMGERRNAGV